MSLHNEIATRERPFDFYGGGAGRKKISRTLRINSIVHIVLYTKDRTASRVKKYVQARKHLPAQLPPPPHPRIKIKWSLPKRDLIACFRSDVNVTFVFSNNLCLKYGCLFRFKNKQHQSISAQT